MQQLAIDACIAISPAPTFQVVPTSNSTALLVVALERLCPTNDQAKQTTCTPVPPLDQVSFLNYPQIDDRFGIKAKCGCDDKVKTCSRRERTSSAKGPIWKFHCRVSAISHTNYFARTHPSQVPAYLRSCSFSPHHDTLLTRNESISPTTSPSPAPPATASPTTPSAA